MDRTVQSISNQADFEFVPVSGQQPNMRTLIGALAIATLAATASACALPPDEAEAAPAETEQSQEAASSTQGCPLGDVCIYPEGTGWNGGHPAQFYFRYGAYNLVNQFGVHRIFNNQFGGATMRTCTGFNGTGCQGFLLENTFIDKNLTPINSITLEP
jgi:hypothetical protein